MTEKFADLLQASCEHINFESGALITGVIVEIRSDYIVVNAGLKSEGIIPISEFQHEEVHVGDTVDVIIETTDNGFGETCLSHEKARRAKDWVYLEKSYKDESIVHGTIIDRVKGGFTVSIKINDNTNFIHAFLPGSLADVRPVRDATYLENKELEFKIIKMDKRRSNVVLSRRAVMEAENSAERSSRLEALKEGDLLTGIVKNITEYGAFIDLGSGVDGLLHIVDISWKRMKHPDEMLKIGDELRLVILRIDRKKERISLGMKQLVGDPWTNIERRYSPGMRVFGTVTNITDYGCFVQLEEGIEGLVHMSELDWTNKNIHPSKVTQSDEEIEVMILDIDEGRRRISLGIKQCHANPWQEFAEKYKKDDKISGEIHSITDFGIFIGLEGNIDGLVHMSDISWSERQEHAIRHYKKGDTIEAMILSIDPDRERISLGIKQLTSDPFIEFLDSQNLENIMTATVVSVDAKQAILNLADGVTGQMRAQHYAAIPPKDLTEEVKVEDTLEVKVINVDRKTRLISLSHKSLEKPPKTERKTSRSPAPYAPTKTTLGDLLKEQMKDHNNEDKD